MTTKRSSLGGGSGGSLYGVKPPPLMSGKLILPDGYRRGHNVTLTLTAARYYYAYHHVDRLETFSGVKFKDSGTGNNGKKVKIAAFTIDEETGAISTLAKDFGEVTLDGTAGIETMASPWTPSYIGWHILALVSDSNPVICTMARPWIETNAGLISHDHHDQKLGTFTADFFAETATASPRANHGEAKDGTYANFPEATGLAPTFSIVGVSNTFPMFGLYK